MKILFVFLILVLSTNAKASSPECKLWFEDSEIDPQSLKCEIQCSIESTDMSTFHCPLQCKELCQNHCGRPDSYWLNKMKNGLPKNWPNKSEKAKPWTEDEKKRVLAALKRMPEMIWRDSIPGIYRLERSVDYPVPGSNDKKTTAIGLYDTSFGGLPDVTPDVVLAHELSHLSYDRMTEGERISYAQSSGWVEKKKTGSFNLKRNDLMREASRKSPEEDFAVNAEFMLFEPEKLKSKIPQVYNWMVGKFGNKFKADSGCLNAK